MNGGLFFVHFFLIPSGPRPSHRDGDLFFLAHFSHPKEDPSGPRPSHRDGGLFFAHFFAHPKEDLSGPRRDGALALNAERLCGVERMQRPFERIHESLTAKLSVDQKITPTHWAFSG